MQEIEIRRTLSAANVISVQANPAIVAGTNGEPNRVVVALEITTDGGQSLGDSPIYGREVFAIPLAAMGATEAALANAHVMADLLAEDLS